MGLLLSAVNPKNLAMCIAAGAAIGGGTEGTSEAVVAIVVSVVIALASIAVPVLGYLVAQERMRQPLDELPGSG